MYKKIMVVALSSLILGGCSLTDKLQREQAASDASEQEPVMVKKVTPTTSDQELDAMPSTTTSLDIDSIEADLKNTTILEEDFSDL